MANPNDKQIAKLRDAWEKAIAKDKPKDAQIALEGLERLEPLDPRWPHRHGDVLRRLNRTADAERAYMRAMDIYNKQGFIARAVAVAKIIQQINPSRGDVLKGIEQGPAKQLRSSVRPPPMSASNLKITPPPPVNMEPPREPIAPPSAPRMHVQPAPPPPPPALRPSGEMRAASPSGNFEAAAVSARGTFVAGMPSGEVKAIATAMHLAPAADRASDEVRFEDVPEEMSVDIELTDLDIEEVHPAPTGGAPSVHPPGPSAAHLALMTATTLFAEVPIEALAALAKVSELLELDDGAEIFQHGDPADALFVIAEGSVTITVPELQGAELTLTEGQLFGEGCLLQDGIRQIDATVTSRLVALRIPWGALAGIVKEHKGVGEVLFDLLIQRLVARTLLTSPLFAAFDPDARKDLAKLFEVRRAVRGVVLKEMGKRSDGLYLPLAGELETDDGASKGRVALGTMFGQQSMLSQAPARRTVRVLREAVLLRLPASRFGTFAMQYPPALAHLAELAESSGF